MSAVRPGSAGTARPRRTPEGGQSVKRVLGRAWSGGMGRAFAGSALIERLRTREEQLFLILTVVVGILAGLSAVLFSVTIEVVNRALFGLSPSSARMLVVPIAGSLVSGLLLAKVLTGV